MFIFKQAAPGSEDVGIAMNNNELNMSNQSFQSDKVRHSMPGEMGGGEGGIYYKHNIKK